MTIKELIEELKKYPEEMEVQRLMTVQFGVTEIESVSLSENKNYVVID